MQENKQSIVSILGWLLNLLSRALSPSKYFRSQEKSGRAQSFQSGCPIAWLSDNNREINNLLTSSQHMFSIALSYKTISSYLQEIPIFTKKSSLSLGSQLLNKSLSIKECPPTSRLLFWADKGSSSDCLMLSLPTSDFTPSSPHLPVSNALPFKQWSD